MGQQHWATGHCCSSSCPMVGEGHPLWCLSSSNTAQRQEGWEPPESWGEGVLQGACAEAVVWGKQQIARQRSMRRPGWRPDVMVLGSGASPEGLCEYRVLCAARFVLCTACYVLCTVHCAPCAVHHALCTMSCVHYALSAPCPVCTML